MNKEEFDKMINSIVEKEICINQMDLVKKMVVFMSPSLDNLVENPQDIKNIEKVLFDLKELFIGIQKDAMDKFDVCIKDLEEIDMPQKKEETIQIKEECK